MPFLLSTLALVLAPFAYAFGRRHPVARQMLDGFIFITIAGIVGVTIIPEALSFGGYAAFGFLALGLALPFILEKARTIPHRSAHLFIVVVAGAGLAVHAAIDGVALLDENLAPGIILHRLPVGMAIWWSVRPTFGSLVAGAVFAVIIAATALAWLLGPTFLQMAEGPGVAWFQAFVAGSLVHVIAFGVSHEHDEQVEPAASFRDWGYRIGILAGLVLMFSE
jgi:hypothetical protein